MYKFKKEEISKEHLEKIKNQWYTKEEAIEEMSLSGNKMSISAFNREEPKVDCDKELFDLGKPEIKEESIGGRGRPRKIYNRAFIEAMRSFAISDSFKKVEEYPIDFFVNKGWKEDIEEEFKEALKPFIEKRDLYEAVDELTTIIGDEIIQKYNTLIGLNKFLVHQNRKLEDTKEYYIAQYRGVEENANVLNNIANHIKQDIDESSEILGRKEAMHLKATLNVNQKLDEILKTLEDLKNK